MRGPIPPLRRLGLRLAGFMRNRRGNVAILTALMMIPMLSALGMGVDYAMQMQRKDRLNGISDATALYALTPTLMTYASSVAQTKAQQFWSAQAAMVKLPALIDELYGMATCVPEVPLKATLVFAWLVIGVLLWPSVVPLEGYVPLTPLPEES